MFHVKKIVFVLIVAITIFSVAGQGSYTYRPGVFSVELKADSSIERRIKVTPLYSTLNDYERGFLYALNYVRLHPKAFKEEALDPYLKLYPQLRPKYGESLQEELLTLNPSTLTEVEGRLLKLARLHAKDLASVGILSHTSSNGQSFQQRFEGEGIGCGSECINLGQPVSALEALLSLLIDFNVENLGHRRALLNPSMVFVGIGSDFGKENSKMRYTVIDLGCF
jgi:hypothetical protein